MVRASLACVRHLISLDRMWWDWHGQIDSISLLLSVHIVNHEQRFQRIMHIRRLENLPWCMSEFSAEQIVLMIFCYHSSVVFGWLVRPATSKKLSFFELQHRVKLHLFEKWTHNIMSHEWWCVWWAIVNKFFEEDEEVRNCWKHFRYRSFHKNYQRTAIPLTTSHKPQFATVKSWINRLIGLTQSTATNYTHELSWNVGGTDWLINWFILA